MYKRQEFDGKLIGSMEELSSTMEYYKAGTTVDVKIERSMNGEYPVSYTHLDVYKRQGDGASDEPVTISFNSNAFARFPSAEIFPLW